MKLPLLLILLLFLLSGCAPARFSVKDGIGRFAIPFAFPQPQKQGFTRQLDLVYIGIPKTSLYKLFKKFRQTKYRKQGNQEWVTFSMRETNKSGDAATFYLSDGKVKQWQKAEEIKSD